MTKKRTKRCHVFRSTSFFWQIGFYTLQKVRWRKEFNFFSRFILSQGELLKQRDLLTDSESLYHTFFRQKCNPPFFGTLLWEILSVSRILKKIELSCFVIWYKRREELRVLRSIYINGKVKWIKNKRVHWLHLGFQT